MTRQQPIPYPLIKQLTDKLVAAAIILLFSPVLAVVGLGMALDMLLRPADRGPWFYRERRISRGREFDILKFRVLRQNVLTQMRQAGGHARQYEANLNNLTWAGRYLIKKWYLDELPQLLNILKGDMSLVGPRPWPISMVQEQVARGVTYRHLIMAGWTGPAQLQKGRPTPKNSEMLDLEYAAACRTWSAWRLWRYDLNILYQTARVMLQGQGLKY